MKRKNRRDYYARKKDDLEWIQKERERNNERMKHKRLDPEYKKRTQNVENQRLFVNVVVKLQLIINQNTLKQNDIKNYYKSNCKHQKQFNIKITL